MTDDERAIRELVQSWIDASRAGDTAKVLSLMTDDVVFTVPGQEPFGKAAFAEAFPGAARHARGGNGRDRRASGAGDWALLRNRIDISVTPPGATQAMRRAGYTLTLVRKDANGRWLLARGANLVAAKDQAALAAGEP